MSKYLERKIKEIVNELNQALTIVDDMEYARMDVQSLRTAATQAAQAVQDINRLIGNIEAVNGDLKI